MENEKQNEANQDITEKLREKVTCYKFYCKLSSVLNT